MNLFEISVYEFDFRIPGMGNKESVGHRRKREEDLEKRSRETTRAEFCTETEQPENERRDRSD